MISTATGYAASALGYLAVRADGPMPVRDLARAVDAPAPYLSKIIHLLALRGLVDTTKGKGGGVILRADAGRLTLYDLCIVMDDAFLRPCCALGTAPCSETRQCPAHTLHMAIRARQERFLKRTTIQRIGRFNAKAAHDRNVDTPVLKGALP
jgi:Rrf2 family protein